MGVGIGVGVLVALGVLVRAGAAVCAGPEPGDEEEPDRRGALHPASIACCTLQNHRSPFDSSIIVRS